MTEAEWVACADPARMLERTDGGGRRKSQLLTVAILTTDVAPDTNREYLTRLEVAARFADGTLSLAELRAHWPSEGMESWPERAEEWAREVVVGELQEDPPLIPPARLSGLIRDIFGNPFRPVAFSPAWRTETVLSLARQMHESREFSAMPILADALQVAGCEEQELLAHCRGDGPHVRGCWVVDLVLGKG